MRILLVVVAAIAIPLSACGDDAKPDAAPSESAEILDPRGPPFGVSVSARDFAFEPSEWLVPSSALLVVDFENDGAVEHTFVVIADGSIETSADFSESLVYRQLRAEPGELSSDSFLAPGAPGTYQVVCKVPGHLELGMEALLIVEP